MEYEKANYISTICTFAKLSFVKKGFNPSKIWVNYLGVDLSQFSYIKREFVSSQLHLGYVGTLSARKNVAGLILTIETLRTKGLDLHLILAGPIDHSSFASSLLDKPYINYFGVLKQEKLIHIYGKMEVFVLNSIEDGFGMVLLQAMSTGLPVIASENTGGPDVIKHGENGFIVKFDDNQDLSEKITWFSLNKLKLHQMSKAARETVEKGFSWKDYGNRYIEKLQEIV